jgi:phage tail sheath protein FI
MPLFNEGYFAGTSATQAFRVICDSTNNSQNTIDQGQVIIDVLLAPQKPAEFVRFRFTQKSIT